MHKEWILNQDFTWYYVEEILSEYNMLILKLSAIYILLCANNLIRNGMQESVFKRDRLA